MTNVTETILNAINTGSVISIVYNGGKIPGQSRVIIPIAIKNETLVAREPKSRRSKIFKVQDVESASIGSSETISNHETTFPPINENIIPKYKSLQKYSKYFKKILNSPNFYFLEEDHSFAVGVLIKKDTPSEIPIATIRFVDMTVMTVFNANKGIFEERKSEPTGSERPWIVNSVSLKENKEFSQLHEAIEFFYQEVLANKPIDLYRNL